MSPRSEFTNRRWWLLAGIVLPACGGETDTTTVGRPVSGWSTAAAAPIASSVEPLPSTTMAEPELPVVAAEEEFVETPAPEPEPVVEPEPEPELEPEPMAPVNGAGLGLNPPRDNEPEPEPVIEPEPEPTTELEPEPVTEADSAMTPAVPSAGGMLSAGGGFGTPPAMTDMGTGGGLNPGFGF